MSGLLRIKIDIKINIRITNLCLSESLIISCYKSIKPFGPKLKTSKIFNAFLNTLPVYDDRYIKT